MILTRSKFKVIAVVIAGCTLTVLPVTVPVDSACNKVTLDNLEQNIFGFSAPVNGYFPNARGIRFGKFKRIFSLGSVAPAVYAAGNIVVAVCIVSYLTLPVSGLY